MYAIASKLFSMALIVLGMIFALVSFTACAGVATTDATAASPTVSQSSPTAAPSNSAVTPASTQSSTEITQFSSSTTSSSAAAQVQPRNVPLPEQATRLGVGAVVADNGRKATQWRYTVASTSPGTVLDFYRSNMPSNGWTFVASSATGREGGQVLRYAQGYRTCYIEVLASRTIPGNTSLFITVTN